MSTDDEPPGWIEVRLLVPEGWQELVADAIGVGGSASVAFGRPNLAVPPAPEGFDYLRSFYSAHLDGEAARAGVRARLAALAEHADVDELRGLEPTFRELPHEDWATSWQKVWRPYRVGRLAVVTRAWAGTLRADDVAMVLEPGGAFGTGRHATTRLCLRALQELDLDGARVLDAGSGSGILSVAAALFGATAVLGFDVDERGEVEGGALAARNGVAGRCAFRSGDFGVLAPDERDFDLVLANIYSDVLQDHAREFRERLAPGGRCVLSGCPDRHAGPTLAALEAGGLTIDEIRRRGRWLAFLGRRP
jgi:ribosomal protein L11 methyltransferase